MNWRSSTMMILGTMVVAGCSFGPRFDAAMPQVRSVPVLADLTPAQSLVQGRTYLAARQYGLAIELFKTAARDPAQRADSLNGLAVAYDGIGRADLAERYFQEALAARPGDPRLRANLARFYAVSGQSDKRRDLLAAAVPARTVPDVPAAVAEPAAGPAPQDGGEAPAAAALVAAEAPVIGGASPLDRLFQPLLVNASLPPIPAREGTADAAPLTVACQHPRGQSPARDGHAMKMLRISMGEVFILSEPAGAACTVEGGVAVAETAEPPASRLSNSEYLGLVAAYLDQMNRTRAATEFLALWRAAFRASEPA